MIFDVCSLLTFKLNHNIFRIQAYDNEQPMALSPSIPTRTHQKKQSIHSARQKKIDANREEEADEVLYCT